MPRQPIEYQALHDAADSIEPRLARAFSRAVPRMRDLVKINDLALALASRNVKLARRILETAGIDDVLAPAGTISRDAVLRGGKVGAKTVNRLGRKLQR